jgi:hydrogenase-4 component F
MGLMAIAFGFGGPLAITAGLLHLANHAATKSLLFIVAGRVRQRYGNRRIGAIRGMAAAEPVAAMLLFAGVLAIVGMPPFSIFVSEIGIVSAGFGGSAWDIAVAAATVALLGIIFAGFIRHLIGMCTGASPHDLAAPARPEAPWLAAIAVAPLLAAMVLFGVHVPDPARDLFREIASIIEPGGAEVAQR